MSLLGRSSWKPFSSIFSSSRIRTNPFLRKYSSGTETPFQQLLTHCYDGNEKKVFELIQQDPTYWNTLFDLQFPTSMESTFIGGASKKDSSAPAKNENNIFTSPFLLAIQNGHVNLVQQIINQKLNQQGDFLKKQISDPYHYNLFHILVVGNSQLAPYAPIIEFNQTGVAQRQISWIQITKLFFENFAQFSKENSQIICDLLCQTDENGYTPLMLASKFGQTQFILLILNFMMQYDYQHQTRLLHKMLSAQGKFKKETCLHVAATTEREDVIMSLIAAGADWNALDSDNLSVIDVLAQSKHEPIQQIVSLLKQKKLDQSLFQRIWFSQQVNLQEKDAFGNSALHTACMMGNIQKVKAILSQPNINVNEKNELGFTPLLTLFLNAQLDFPERDSILKMLVETANADVNTSYMNDLVPLSYANFMPVSTVKLLFQFKANPNWKSTTDGHTPSHTLLSNDMLNMTIVELFLNNGADLNAKSSDGISPFLIAVVKNHQVFIERLVEHHLDKIDFTVKHEPSGTDALLTAANNGNFDLVKLFIEKAHLNLNHVGANKMNVLFYAIHFANEQMIAYLVQHGAKITNVEGTVTTPLAIAVMTQNPTIVDMLIKAGADVDEKDSYGLIPLDYVNNLLQQSKQTGALHQIATLLQSKSQPKRE